MSRPRHEITHASRARGGGLRRSGAAPTQGVEHSLRLGSGVMVWNDVGLLEEGEMGWVVVRLDWDELSALYSVVSANSLLPLYPSSLLLTTLSGVEILHRLSHNPRSNHDPSN